MVIGYRGRSARGKVSRSRISSGDGVGSRGSVVVVSVATPLLFSVPVPREVGSAKEGDASGGHARAGCHRRCQGYAGAEGGAGRRA